MPSFLLTIEYDGSGFSGLQIQGTTRTVELVLRNAVSQFVKGDWYLVFSSRTDSGVHAFGQTALLRSDNLSVDVVQKALDALLPSDVRVVDVKLVSDCFHPRGSARLREYHYFFTNTPCPVFFSSFVCKVSYDHLFDFNTVATVFLGAHDFSAFKASGGAHNSASKFVVVSKCVDFEINLGTSGSRFIGKKYVIVADSFLYRMVRNIVGSILECAAGRLSTGNILDMLNSGVRLFPFRTAPARGLVLKKVYY